MERGKRVYLAQLKCPANHCIIALTGVFGSFEEAAALEPALRETFEKAIARGVLKRECGICKTATFHIDIGVTPFATLEQAMPTLMKLQAEQAATAIHLKQSRN